MGYVITNNSNKVYIRLDEHGHPETCSKQDAQRFESSKARNILDNLPKSMKKFHFKVEVIPDEISQKTIPCTTEKRVIKNDAYCTPVEVQNWVDRVKTCNNLAKDASERKKYLVSALSNADKELSNCLHKIELEKWKDGCTGYKEYKSVKLILEKRRTIKDELIVVTSILDSNLESIAADRIEKIVGKLGTRRFEMREVEEYDDL